MTKANLTESEPTGGASTPHPSGFPFAVTVNHTEVECQGCSRRTLVHDAVYTQVLTCGCNQVIDMEGRVLGPSKLKGSKRVKVARDDRDTLGSSCPLQVGDQGTLRGERLVVTGWTTWRATCYDGSTEDWKEYTLLTETGEYRYLSSEGEHFLLGRDDAKPGPDMVYLQQPGDHKQRVTLDGRDYHATSLQTATLQQVGGQLNCRRVPGDRVQFCDAYAPPDVVSVERNMDHATLEGADWEVARSEWIPYAEVRDGFPDAAAQLHEWWGYALKPSWGHPAQPIWRSATQRLITKSLGAIGLLLFAIAIILAVAESPKQLFKAQIVARDLQEGVLTRTFQITSAPTTCRLRLGVPGLSNGWVYATAQIVEAKTGKALVELGKEVSYYHGVEGGESWSEGSTEESGYFRIQRPGEYRLLLSGEFQQGDGQRQLQVTVDGGFILTRWLWLAGLLALLYPGWIAYRRRRLHREGWDEVSDDEGDDD